MKKRHVVVRRRQLPPPPQRARAEPAWTSTRSKAVKYGECQRNHAASVGGYAVDGCREFMAGGEEGTAGAVSCAACGCHRSFHRREQQGEEGGGGDEYEYSSPCSSGA